jgi:hypothetical protein
VNSNTLAFAIAVVAIAMAAYLFGRSKALRAERERRRELCLQFHDIALAQHEASQPILAALAAAEAAGHVDRHECYDVIAAALDEIDLLAAAADYWHRARTSSSRQASAQQAYYYYREAKSFLRARNFEFAYLRSDAAIGLIELGDIPSRVGERDYLQHLRGVRMVSSLHHLNGTAASKAALADAVWLQSRASDKTLAQLGASMSAAQLVGEITADMIASV